MYLQGNLVSPTVVQGWSRSLETMLLTRARVTVKAGRWLSGSGPLSEFPREHTQFLAG